MTKEPIITRNFLTLESQKFMWCSYRLLNELDLVQFNLFHVDTTVSCLNADECRNRSCLVDVAAAVSLQAWCAACNRSNAIISADVELRQQRNDRPLRVHHTNIYVLWIQFTCWLPSVEHTRRETVTVHDFCARDSMVASTLQYSLWVASSNTTSVMWWRYSAQVKIINICWRRLYNTCTIQRCCYPSVTTR